jgi:hypothetical protein
VPIGGSAFQRPKQSQYLDIGNSRGEVAFDPSDPSLAAEQLGRELFERKYSDYRFDTQPTRRLWFSEP